MVHRPLTLRCSMTGRPAGPDTRTCTPALDVVGWARSLLHPENFVGWFTRVTTDALSDELAPARLAAEDVAGALPDQIRRIANATAKRARAVDAGPSPLVRWLSYRVHRRSRGRP